ncbi:hypothetical protein TNCV_3463371 [Trichonephila clavipes]|nr:hypothetical protein TNCV_3463371 [Trichonephila clavipes]
MRVLGFIFSVLLFAVILSFKLLADAVENSSIHTRNNSEIMLLNKKIETLVSQVNKLKDLSPKKFPKVKELSYLSKKRILVSYFFPSC